MTPAKKTCIMREFMGIFHKYKHINIMAIFGVMPLIEKNGLMDILIKPVIMTPKKNIRCLALKAII